MRDPVWSIAWGVGMGVALIASSAGLVAAVWTAMSWLRKVTGGAR